MPKQTTHVGVVREWCQSLGILSAVSISRQEAEIKLALYVPNLISDFPDAAFTAASLNHVAKACVKGFPTYAELYNALRTWWRENRPIANALPAPAQRTPEPERPPPTDEERAYVRRCVEEITANLRNPDAEKLRDRDPGPRYLTPEQLDRVNPLPNGRKRAPGEDDDGR
jgi:hypothetical protein